MTRGQILQIAESAIGTPYLWGGDAWDPTDRSRLGADCSGLIVKAWQLEAPQEVWEELPVRPTTYSLVHPNAQWSHVDRAERLPGDAFVRHDIIQQHAYIFEANAPHQGDQEILRLIEAPEPGKEIRRIHLPLKDLADYSVVRRSSLDNVGFVGRTKTRVYGRFIDAFRDLGGEDEVGQPYDEGEGLYVHSVEGTPGLVQTFRRKGGKRIALYASRPGGIVFPVSGEIYETYLSAGGPQGDWGWPTSFPAEVPAGNGNDTLQAFEHRMVVIAAGQKLIAASH